MMAPITDTNTPNDPSSAAQDLVKGNELYVVRGGRPLLVRLPSSRRGRRRWQTRGETALWEEIKPVYGGTYGSGGNTGLGGFGDDGVELAAPRASRAPLLAPLAPIVSQVLDYDKLCALGRHLSFPFLALLVVMLQSSMSVDFWMSQAGGGVPTNAGGVPLSPLTPAHAADLTRWGVIRPKPRHQGVGLGIRHFLVWKADGVRTRLVSAAQHIQRPKWWLFPPGLELFDITLAANSVHAGEYALALDMSSFFFQFPICGTLFLRLAQARHIYVFQRLPQGWGGSPFVAQMVLALLAFGLVTTQLLWLDNWVRLAKRKS
jgi:hypothetical protein